MSKGTPRDAIVAMHHRQDQELAKKVGVGKIDHRVGIDSKIPLRVTSEVAPGGYARKETVVKK